MSREQEAVETPRTNAEYWKEYPNGKDGWDFARGLERALQRIATMDPTIQTDHRKRKCRTSRTL
jgi:hypothetical protein